MIIGIDEVGRGCWAGPLVASAVGLPEGIEIFGLTDSKKLSAKRRAELLRDIQQATTTIGVGWVWPREINTLGLTKSVQLAMQRAIDSVAVQYSKIIIDGNINYLPHLPSSEAVIKADGSVAAVSAASIVAKVARDTYMIKIAEKYADYGFEKHVGYGTKMHIEALSKHGVTPIHRINYKPVKKWLMEAP
jgi:ribonuclease HII